MRYAEVRNNFVVNIVVGEDLSSPFVACSDNVGIGWTYENNQFSPPIPVYVWTSYEFLMRLTAEERALIRQNSLTDNLVADFLMLAQSAQEIRSDDPITIMGMDYMVSCGIFSEQRRDEILG